MEEYSALRIIRDKSWVVLVFAAVLTIVIGGGIGASRDVNALARDIRAKVREPVYSGDTYPFKVDLSLWESAEGLADDFALNADITWGPSKDIKPSDIEAEVRFGFPFQSHSYMMMRSMRPDNPVTLIGGTGWRFGDRAVPLNLKIVGFVGNTAAFYVVLMLVMVVFRVGQYRWCVARGVCPKCQYDLRGVAGRCPECGVGGVQV